MELTKRQALLVVKLLQAAPEGAVNAYQDDIDELDEAVEAFLTGSDDQGDTGDVDMGDEEDEEDDESEDEDDDEDEDDESDDPVSDGVIYEGTVSPRALNDLSPVKTTEWVAAGTSAKTVEFEMVYRSETVDVITTDGVTELENVRYVSRSADRLELYVDGEWYDYGVTKFPKGWATTLPLGQVLKVGA